MDEVFKLGIAHPMGPLTLADFIEPTSASTSCGYCSLGSAILNTGHVRCSSRWLTRGGWAVSQDVGSISTEPTIVPVLAVHLPAQGKPKPKKRPGANAAVH